MEHRACRRCIARKRKCNSAWPKCHECERVEEDCVYSVKRKRGPIAGFAKMTEARVQACENALWYLLQEPVVQEKLRERLSFERLTPCPARLRSAEEKVKFWEQYPLRTVADIERFRLACAAQDKAPQSPSPEASSLVLPRSSSEEIRRATLYPHLDFGPADVSSDTGPEPPVGLLASTAPSPLRDFSYSEQPNQGMWASGLTTPTAVSCVEQDDIFW